MKNIENSIKYLPQGMKTKYKLYYKINPSHSITRQSDTIPAKL